jgi:hypothetical protein
VGGSPQVALARVRKRNGWLNEVWRKSRGQ